ncbi:MAG: phosphatase PAP2 family protein [Neisseriaceae bacterium]
MGCPVRSCQNKFSIRNYWLFIFFTLLAIGIYAFNFNQKLFLIINSIHGILPDNIWLAINYIAAPRHFILAVILVLLALLFRRNQLARLLILIALYYILFFGLKRLIGEARPFIVLPAESFHWLNQVESPIGREYMSFPSGHSGLIAIFVFSLISLFSIDNKLVQFVLLLFLILVCMARVCTGWHWPLDVILSALIGYLLVKICFCCQRNYRSDGCN